MKTISEYEKERKENIKNSKEKKLKDLNKWIDDLDKKDINLIKFPETSAWSSELEELEKFRQKLRKQIRDGFCTRLYLACDNCKTEIVDREPGMMTLSIPPKISVGCPGCGWIGYMAR